MDGQPKRKKLIEDLNTQYKLGLGDKEIKSFVTGASVGAPIKDLKQYLSLSEDERKKSGLDKGIPTDSANNELGAWIEYGVAAQGGSVAKLKYCIKADNQTPYPKIKEILDTFKKKHIQKLNLVTNLEEAPKGTAAWEEANAPKK